MGFPGGSDGKESACNVGDLGSIPGLGRYPGEGNGNQLQYSCLENSKDRGAWWAVVHRPKKKKCKKAKWFSDEALQITEERREVKSKGKGKGTLN